MINFYPFPNLETNNLLLRRMNYNDLNDLYEMRKDSRMHEFTDTIVDTNCDETKAYIDKMNKGIDENKWIIWAIENKQANRVIGTISIWNINIEQNSGEFGYGLIPDYQGQGLMKEALLSVIDYGFTKMNLEELYAYTEQNNLRSIRILEKCKFVEVNRVDEESRFSKRVFHMVVYKLISQNFKCN